MANFDYLNYLMENTFENKTVLITGASRGIGKAIAIKLASLGANIAVAAKTVEEHPKLEGTIFSAAKEIEAAGSGSALPFQLDVRDDAAIQELVQKVVDAFGGIDILVNNASAISLTSTENTEPKKYDLMQDINVRGSFHMSKACIPHLKKSANAHILNISPPLTMNPKWFGPYLAYAMSKFGMSMVVLGLAEELRKQKIAVNALWPKTTIATAAVQNLLGGDMLMKKSRKPSIMADAAAAIFQKESSSCTGNFFVDEDLLRAGGVENFDDYLVTPGERPMRDLFI